MSPQTSAEYRGGFFDMALRQHIAKENRWNKGIPKSQPPSHTYYKPILEIARRRVEVAEAVQTYYPGLLRTGKEGEIWYLKDSLAILRFLGFDKEPGVAEDLVFTKSVAEKMKQFLIPRLGRHLSGRALTLDESKLDDQNYQEFLGAKELKYQMLFIPSPARLAGMIDASTGGITLKGVPYNRGNEFEHTLTLVISCDHPGFIEGMKQKYGGGQTSSNPEEDSEYGAGWIGAEGTAGKVLEDAFPHLVLRKAQAALGLDYLATTKLFDRRRVLPFEKTLPFTQGDLVNMLLDGFVYNMQLLNAGTFGKPSPHSVRRSYSPSLSSSASIMQLT